MRAAIETRPVKTGLGHQRGWTVFVATVVLVTTAIASALLAATGAGAADNPIKLGAATGGGVSVGHSGWSWGDPQPQGNRLNGIDFAGSRGYAAGDFGTLLRTD